MKQGGGGGFVFVAVLTCQLKSGASLKGNSTWLELDLKRAFNRIGCISQAFARTVI